MRPRCIVSDLDRTLTDAHLAFDASAGERIDELRRAGIRVVIATGRRFEDLLAMGLVDRVDGIVAENGALICVPGERIFQVLHSDFAELAQAALGDLAQHFVWGRVIGSGPRASAAAASERLTRAGVPHEMEYNAEEVMILPGGVSKASGAELCVARLGLRSQEAWAIGDGENDAALLRWAHVGAAPANAVPAARAAAGVHLRAGFSNGFLEFTRPLVATPPHVT